MEKLGVKIGSKFNRLEVIACGPDTVDHQGWNVRRWTCQCVCGNTIVTPTGNLTSGNTQSCGCLRRENGQRLDNKYRTHGLTNTPEHRIWLNLKYRCTAPNAPNRKYYSDQGVVVDERWMESFEVFLNDVGPRPSPIHTLDRYPDPFGNYRPGNVRWATKKEQARNRRDNNILTIGDETHCIAEWEEIAGLPAERVRQRLKKGWPIERLLLPLGSKRA